MELASAAGVGFEPTSRGFTGFYFAVLGFKIALGGIPYNRYNPKNLPRTLTKLYGLHHPTSPPGRSLLDPTLFRPEILSDNPLPRSPATSVDRSLPTQKNSPPEHGPKATPRAYNQLYPTLASNQEPQNARNIRASREPIPILHPLPNPHLFEGTLKDLQKRFP